MGLLYKEVDLRQKMNSPKTYNTKKRISETSEEKQEHLKHLYVRQFSVFSERKSTPWLQSEVTDKDSVDIAQLIKKTERESGIAEDLTLSKHAHNIKSWIGDIPSEVENLYGFEIQAIALPVVHGVFGHVYSVEDSNDPLRVLIVARKSTPQNSLVIGWGKIVSEHYSRISAVAPPVIPKEIPTALQEFQKTKSEFEALVKEAEEPSGSPPTVEKFPEEEWRRIIQMFDKEKQESFQRLHDLAVSATDAYNESVTSLWEMLKEYIKPGDQKMESISGLLKGLTAVFSEFDTLEEITGTKGAAAIIYANDIMSRFEQRANEMVEDYVRKDVKLEKSYTVNLYSNVPTVARMIVHQLNSPYLQGKIRSFVDNVLNPEKNENYQEYSKMEFDVPASVLREAMFQAVSAAEAGRIITAGEKRWLMELYDAVEVILRKEKDESQLGFIGARFLSSVHRMLYYIFQLAMWYLFLYAKLFGQANAAHEAVTGVNGVQEFGANAVYPGLSQSGLVSPSMLKSVNDVTNIILDLNDKQRDRVLKHGYPDLDQVDAMLTESHDAIQKEKTATDENIVAESRALAEDIQALEYDTLELEQMAELGPQVQELVEGLKQTNYSFSDINDPRTFIGTSKMTITNSFKIMKASEKLQNALVSYLAGNGVVNKTNAISVFNVTSQETTHDIMNFMYTEGSNALQSPEEIETWARNNRDVVWGQVGQLVGEDARNNVAFAEVMDNIIDVVNLNIQNIALMLTNVEQHFEPNLHTAESQMHLHMMNTRNIERLESNSQNAYGNAQKHMKTIPRLIKESNEQNQNRNDVANAKRFQDSLYNTRPSDSNDVTDEHDFFSSSEIVMAARHRHFYGLAGNRTITAPDAQNPAEAQTAVAISAGGSIFERIVSIAFNIPFVSLIWETGRTMLRSIKEYSTQKAYGSLEAAFNLLWKHCGHFLSFLVSPRLLF